MARGPVDWSSVFEPLEQVIDQLTTKTRKQNLVSTSSWIDSVSYDEDTQTMVIGMRGRSYTFRDVPEYVYDGLVMAPSPGEYYHSAIKGNYS